MNRKISFALFLIVACLLTVIALILVNRKESTLGPIYALQGGNYSINNSDDWQPNKSSRIDEPLSTPPSEAMLYARHSKWTEGPNSKEDADGSGYLIAYANQATSSLSKFEIMPVASSLLSYSRMTGKVAYVESSVNLKVTRIFVISAGVPKEILSLSDGREITGLILSPDGKTIAYTFEYRYGAKPTLELRRIESDGSGDKLVSSDIISKLPPRSTSLNLKKWSRDRQSISFYPTCSCDDPHRPGAYEINVNTKEVKETFDFDTVDPGGSRALLVNNYPPVTDRQTTPTKLNSISLINMLDGRLDKVIESDNRVFLSPVWSPDGNSILYIAAQKGDVGVGEFAGELYYDLNSYGIYKLDLETKREEKITSFVDAYWRPESPFWINSGMIAYTLKRQSPPCCMPENSHLYVTSLADGTSSLVDSSKYDIGILGEYH